METRVEQSIVRHDKGYNCAQAVLCTYADLLGMDEKLAFRVLEGFGFGMGKAQSTCGALSGAIAAISLANSVGPEQITKADTYKKAHALAEAFQAKCGSTICKELKGTETGKMLCSCPDCIREGCRLVEAYLTENGIA